MIELMKDDPHDKQRVKNWCIEKGIDVNDEEAPPTETKRQAPAAPAASSSKQPMPAASSSQKETHGEERPPKRDRDPASSIKHQAASIKKLGSQTPVRN